MNKKLQQIRRLFSKGEYQNVVKLITKKSPKISQEEWYLLALSYRRLKEDKKAYNAFEQAKPTYINSATWSIEYAHLLFKLMEFGTAISLYKRAIEINPKHPDILNVYGSLASIAHYQNQSQEAINYFQKALKLDPKNIKLLKSLAEIYMSIKEIDRGKEIFEYVLTLAEESNNAIEIALARHRLARIVHFHIDKDPKKALLYLTPLLPLKQHPFTAVLADFIATLKLKNSDWEGLEQLFIEVKKGIGKTTNATQNPFSLLSFPNITEEEHQSVVSHTINTGSNRRSQRIKPFPLRLLKPLDGRALRLGLLSSDIMDNHPVSHVLVNVLTLLNREDISLYIYSTSKNISQKTLPKHTKKFMEISNKLYDVYNASSLVIAKQIYADQIDVLVDLNGFTEGARQDVYFYKPAPVIVNWLGYPSTMGSKMYDWVLADQYIIPPKSQKYYTENVWYLPTCYFPTNSSNPIPKLEDKKIKRESLGLPQDAVILSSFANSNKLHPELFDVWCEILKGSKHSILWLRGHKYMDRERLGEELEKRGVSSSRLYFSERVDAIDEYHKHLSLSDLALDTYPYGLHSTAVDYLWSGVPFLTLKGTAFPSRVGESLLHAFNMPDMIASNKQEYIEKAIMLANRPTELKLLKERVERNRVNSKLFDSKQMAKDLEDAFISMYKKKLEGYL